ncbi:MAG: MFS transporter [Myxococcota bacterium]
MNKRNGWETADTDRISFGHKLVYGFGAFVNNLLAGAIGATMIVLNLGLGMDPALVGLLGAIPRLTDAITDPLMGFISDHTRSKWGRRRPYIFVGAIVVGIIYVALWQLPREQSETFYFVYFLIGSFLFYAAYTVFATPWVALGYELTPDYHERTRLMGVQNFIGQLAYVVTPWCLWIVSNKAWFSDQITGARGLAVAVGAFTILCGVMPAIFLRERSAPPPPLSDAGGAAVRVLGNFFKGFATTLRSRSFQKLCVATFLVFNGFILISSFSAYVIIYYVFEGDQVRGSEYAGYGGTIGAVSTFVVIPIVTLLATKIGKRRAFFVSTGISIAGYGMKWFCYTPEMPLLVLLPAPFMAFGLGGLFTLMPSMIADVVDEDELHTHERREGMYGSIFWWVVKVGMAAALAGGGFLLNATGFQVELGSAQSAESILLLRVFDAVIPMLASAVAIYAIAAYPITEEYAHALRGKLEARRGAANEPEPMASAG